MVDPFEHNVDVHLERICSATKVIETMLRLLASGNIELSRDYMSLMQSAREFLDKEFKSE